MCILLEVAVELVIMFKVATAVQVVEVVEDMLVQEELEHQAKVIMAALAQQYLVKGMVAVVAVVQEV
jgi:hypothetical protein